MVITPALLLWGNQDSIEQEKDNVTLCTLVYKICSSIYWQILVVHLPLLLGNISLSFSQFLKGKRHLYSTDLRMKMLGQKDLSLY